MTPARRRRILLRARSLRVELAAAERTAEKLRAERLRAWEALTADESADAMTHVQIGQVYRVKPSTISVALMRKANR